MRFLFLLWVSLAACLVCPESVLAASCTHTVISISPAVVDVPNDAGGMLSKVWHKGSFSFRCANVGTWRDAETPLLEGGVKSGSKIMYEGVSYDLFRTNENDVFYFGYYTLASATTNGNIPLGSGEVKSTKWGTGLGVSFDKTIGLSLRFYSTSKSMSAGQRSLAGANVLGGTLKVDSVAEVIPWSVTFSPFSFVAKGPTCKLTTPSEVTLKQISVYKFSAIGSTVDAATFPLAVKCSANIPTYKVSYALQDVNDNSNMSSNLTLAKGAGEASGVALQILDAGSPINFGLSSCNVLGNLNGGFVSKQLSVRYIKTEPRITPGAVRAGATVTLTYD